MSSFRRKKVEVASVSSARQSKMNQDKDVPLFKGKLWQLTMYSVDELTKVNRETSRKELLLYLELMPSEYLKHSWEYELPKTGEYGFQDPLYAMMASRGWLAYQRKKEAASRTSANQSGPKMEKGQ